MGPQRRAALAALMLMLLCWAPAVQSLSLKNSLNKVLKGRRNELARLAADRVDDLSGVVAGWLDEAGEGEAATVVRSSSDAVESALRAAADGAACAGTMKTGAALAGAVGCSVGPLGCVAGWLVGGAIGGAVTPACHRTVENIVSAVENAVEAADAVLDGSSPGTGATSSTSAARCSGRSFVSPDASYCAVDCAEEAPVGSCLEVDWFYDRGCCLCQYSQYDCEDSSGGSTGGGGGSSSQRPPSAGGSDSGGGSCGSIEYDTDYFGADIVPVTTKWADTAVAAASPEDCCEACSLYSYCGAWTFTPAENCKERFPGAPGCCFLKKGTGYEKRSAAGMVSGTSGGPPVAACTLEFDTDLLGGDIQSGNGPDTVVPTISDADCCQSCAATPGCGAWTMTPPSDCASRLPNARGCCFLKHEGGWTRTKDEKGVLTSGQLIGT